VIIFLLWVVVGFNFVRVRRISFLDYDLVDSVKEWRSEWFYTGIMLPTLAVHTDFGPSVNDRWEKNPLSSEELKKI
jgi:hypothetical protein